MKYLRLTLNTLLVAGTLTVASYAWGQFRGGDDGDRGRGGDSFRGRGGFDPSEFYKRMDRNGNGVIEPDELSERSRGFLSDTARRAGLDLNQPIPLDKLIAASAQARADREREGGSSFGGPSSGGPPGGGPPSGSPGSSSGSSNGDWRGSDRDRDRDRDRGDSDRDRNRDSSSSSSAAKTATPLVPGFGVEDKTPKAAGFDVPLTVDTSVPLEQKYDTRVIEYVDRMLRDYDKNSDGFIDNVEWKEGRWSTPPEESDTNKDGRLSKPELCERIAKRFGLTSGPGSSSSSSGSGNSSRGGDSRGGDSRGSSSDSNQFRRYAEGLLRQHDENRNGTLEKDELSRLKSEHRSADTNNDGVITVDELAVKLQAFSSSSSGGDSSDRRSSWGGRGGSSSTTSTANKGYRFVSPLDRLPKGLPDWFLRNDADSDGQVAMHEYSTSWSDSTAAEFQKYDLNGDGIITAQEVLGGATTTSSGGSSSFGRSSGSDSSRGDYTRGDSSRESRGSFGSGSSSSGPPSSGGDSSRGGDSGGGGGFRERFRSR
jgi:Ca2+-binding EF-hand superfamily protein